MNLIMLLLDMVTRINYLYIVQKYNIIYLLIVIIQNILHLLGI